MTIRPIFRAMVFGLVVAVSASTLLTAASAETSPPTTIDVAIVVPITVPARTTGLIGADELASYTAPSGLLSRELDEVINRPVVLGIDPMIIASIRVLGHSAPPSAVSWLERLSAASNETFALSYADSDITAALQAGYQSVLAPESFDFTIDPAQVDVSLGLRAGSSAAPTPEPEASLPTASQLLAWDYRVPDVAWPVADSVTTSDLTAITTSGFAETILSSDNVNLSDRSRAFATVAGHDVLVSDELLTGLFASAVASDSLAEWETATASLLDGITSVVAGSRSAFPSVLLTLDRALSSSDPDLGRTIDAVAALNPVRSAGLAEIAQHDAVSATLVAGEQGSEKVTAVQELRAAETLDREFSTIAKNPSLIAGARRLDLLALLATGWDRNPEGWAIARNDFLRASTQLRDSVRIVKSSSLNLTADRANLPVTVSNSLDQSVTVYIVVVPETPLLAVENGLVELVVEPHSQRKGQVPVQSLSNGTVELNVSLRSSTGVDIGETSLLRTNVQAGWETPVTISIGVVVVLIFLFGIIRNVLRWRRRNASSE